MNTRHIAVAEIAEVLSSGENDPRRRHLADCVRCRLLVRRYESFLAAGNISTSEREEAERNLTAFLEHEIGAGKTPERPRVLRMKPRRHGLAGWLGASAWRPAFALAGVVAIGAAVFWLGAGNFGEVSKHESTMRGAGGDEAVNLAPPVDLASGAVAFHWGAVAGADRYELRFYTPELSGRGAPLSATDTAFTLEPGVLRDVAAGDTLLCVVTAMSGEAKLARSTPRPVILPRSPSGR